MVNDVSEMFWGVLDGAEEVSEVGVFIVDCFVAETVVVGSVEEDSAGSAERFNVSLDVSE